MPDQMKRIETAAVKELRPAGAATLFRILKSFAAVALLCAVSVGATVLTSPGQARADGIYFSGNGFSVGIGTRGFRGAYFNGPVGFYGPPYRPYGAPYYYHPYDSRAYPYRSRVYVNPPRHRGYQGGQPRRVPYSKTGLAPFTPAWTAYCARKFKSFNPNTGTYLAYSGKYRFCR
ncbi:BA14K family protein [Roseibium marinum]|uniref:Lectin-like protein BA14k n=1 Tax=Roseibium marinum TaxID=281252 RepID=A0A2S3UX61_9HYPH|nr:BA14K family protein [Roseibium marinum]POF32264.1 BA14K-like protein [Roseibium marinum]